MKLRQKPLFVLATAHGTVFNITSSMLPKYGVQGLQLSVGQLYDSREIMKKLPQGWTFKRFIGFKQDVKTYMTPHNFLKEGKIYLKRSKGKQFILKTNSGFVEFDHEKYDQFAQIIQPDYLIGPFNYSKQQIQGHLQTDKSLITGNKSSKYLMPFQVCDDKALMFNYLRHLLLNKQVNGIVVYNLFKGQQRKLRQELFQQIYNMIKSTQRQQFTLSLGGIGKIQDIIQSFSYGINIFQISYPFILARNGIALVKQNSNYLQKIPSLTSQLTPLISNCSCYACQRHSESYIAHLIACKEPNAKILLSLHNLQMYIDLLKIFK